MLLLFGNLGAHASADQCLAKERAGIATSGQEKPPKASKSRNKALKETAGRGW